MGERVQTVFILLIGSLAVILLVLNANDSLDSIACDIRGGSWLEHTESCRMPPQDYKETCYKNSDCSRECVYTGKDDYGYLIGRCSKNIVGCKDTIPEITKDLSDLERKYCEEPQATGVPFNVRQKPGSNLRIQP